MYDIKSNNYNKFTINYLFDSNSLINKFIPTFELISFLKENKFSTLSFNYLHQFPSNFYKGNCSKIKVIDEVETIKYILNFKKLNKPKFYENNNKYCDIDENTLQLLGFLLDIEPLKNIQNHADCCDYSRTAYILILKYNLNQDKNKVFSLDCEKFKEKQVLI